MATMNLVPHTLARALRVKDNVMYLSPPAYGKTTAILNFVRDEQAKDPKFFFLQRDGGTLAPTDVVMSMPDMQRLVIQQLVDSGLPNYYSTPDLVGIIYVGEWMLMALETSKGFQKMLNHEDYGTNRRIPPGVIFVSDGQRLKDKSGAQAQSRAIASRFVTYTLEFDTDYALDVVKQYYHKRVAAFLIRNPQLLDNYADVFDNDQRGANDLALQEGKAGAWPSLRSWDKVSRCMFDRDVTGKPIYPEEIQVRVGSAAASTFEVFQTMLDNLTTMEDIINDPERAPVPTRADEQYALSTMLSLTVDGPKFKPTSVYMNRYPAELQAVFFKLMNDRLTKQQGPENSAIRNSPEYKKWITSPHISKLLAGASAA